MNRTEFAASFKNFLGRYDKFLLSGHIRPDGDSIGACAALCFYLRSIGKEAFVFLDGECSRFTNLLPTFPTLSADELAAYSGFAFIMLDVAEPGRTGRCEDMVMKAKASLCIDHHVSGKEYTDFFYCEPESTSASEVLYALMQEAGIGISREMAIALFMGAAFDTGGFRHSSVTPATYRMAADLMERGANATELINGLFHSRSFSEERGLALAIKNSKLYAGGILVCCLTIGDVFAVQSQMAELDGVAGELNEIRDAEVVCVLREMTDGCIRVNMRSKSRVDVARVASGFGGGGHVRAAGFTSADPMLIVKQNVVAAVRRQLDEQVNE